MAPQSILEHSQPSRSQQATVRQVRPQRGQTERLKEMRVRAKAALLAWSEGLALRLPRGGELLGPASPRPNGDGVVEPRLIGPIVPAPARRGAKRWMVAQAGDPAR